MSDKDDDNVLLFPTLKAICNNKTDSRQKNVETDTTSRFVTQLKLILAKDKFKIA